MQVMSPCAKTCSSVEKVIPSGVAISYLMGKVVESLIVEFDQIKYEEFLSSGSKSPRARQYRKVSLEIRSRISSEASLNVVGAEIIMARRTMHNARVNVSPDIHEVSVDNIQCIHAHTLPQF